MIDRRYFNRFYAVFWRTGVGKKGRGQWNFVVKDSTTEEAFGGSESGLTKKSFEKAQAAVVHWAMYRHNTRSKKRDDLGRLAR